MIAIIVLGNKLYQGDDKTLFMPGQMTNGHYQIELACDACHTDKFGGGEVLQKSCIKCHGDDRVKPHDSHPKEKFTDPRNADRLEKINAVECITCHKEHKPEITKNNGLTQPLDICSHCHQDIAKERPSHTGMPFTSCKDSGCHNYHNNRALYTDFLIKHLDEADNLEKQTLPQREFLSVLDEVIEYPRERYPVQILNSSQADAPASINEDDQLHQDWLTTAHARSGVNCSACHVVNTNEKNSKPEWTDHPGDKSCAQCHNLEVSRFKKGKHGMRLQVGLPPMSTSQAKLPMNTENGHRSLTCNSCHAAHSYDTKKAAVEGCLECHNDNHSKTYKTSSHYFLWVKETTELLPAGSGVSCASCHMPRVNFDMNEWSSRIMVDHNQSANLSPNSKMIRSSCIKCHGLEFTLNALADKQLIDNNFYTSPAVKLKTMEMAESERKRAIEETAGIE